jgi:hypothetical protein
MVIFFPEFLFFNLFISELLNLLLKLLICKNNNFGIFTKDGNNFYGMDILLGNAQKKLPKTTQQPHQNYSQNLHKKIKEKNNVIFHSLLSYYFILFCKLTKK